MGTRLAIRLLLYLLVATVLAVSIAIGGYSLLLSLGKEPATPVRAVTIESFATLPEPKRLARRPSVVPASFRDEDSILVINLEPLVLEVRDLPTNFRAGAGIAVFQPELQAMFSWLPLAEAEQSESGSLTLQTEAPTGQLKIVVAPSEEAARRGYWLAVNMDDEDAREAPTVLSVPVQEVRVRVVTVPALHERLLRLRREGDDHWRPEAAFQTSSHTATEQGHVDLVLGPGTYQLTPWTGSDWEAIPIHVPGPAEVTTRFRR